MTMRKRWQDWENTVAHDLGLDTTIHSGVKFYDPGDVVTRGREAPFPLLADCKYTEARSYRLTASALHQLSGTATALGKRFLLPLRFAHRDGVGAEDYVVMSYHDFRELLDGYRV
jgi:hypothetical protein